MTRAGSWCGRPPASQRVRRWNRNLWHIVSVVPVYRQATPFNVKRNSLQHS